MNDTNKPNSSTGSGFDGPMGIFDAIECAALAVIAELARTGVLQRGELRDNNAYWLIEDIAEAIRSSFRRDHVRDIEEAINRGTE